MWSCGYDDHELPPVRGAEGHAAQMAGFHAVVGVMAALFADPATRRVVVEPDVRNKAVHALNEAVGFVPEREITKPEKEALLSFCTRDRFEAATGIFATGTSASGTFASGAFACGTFASGTFASAEEAAV